MRLATIGRSDGIDTLTDGGDRRCLPHASRLSAVLGALEEFLFEILDAGLALLDESHKPISSRLWPDLLRESEQAVVVAVLELTVANLGAIRQWSKDKVAPLKILNTVEVFDTDTASCEEVDDTLLKNIPRLGIGTLFALLDGTFDLVCITIAGRLDLSILGRSVVGFSILRLGSLVQVNVNIVLVRRLAGVQCLRVYATYVRDFSLGLLNISFVQTIVGLRRLVVVQCVQASTTARVLEGLLRVFHRLSFLVLSGEGLTVTALLKVCCRDLIFVVTKAWTRQRTRLLVLHLGILIFFLVL